jgi:hypothetical protein
VPTPNYGTPHNTIQCQLVLKHDGRQQRSAVWSTHRCWNSRYPITTHYTTLGYTTYTTPHHTTTLPSPNSDPLLSVQLLSITTLTDCTANSGGAVWSTGDSLTVLDRAMVTNSHAYTDGGAIGSVGVQGLPGPTVEIIGTNITGCSTNGNGGAVWGSVAGKYNVVGSDMSGNSAGNDGGGIFVKGVELNLYIERTIVGRNTATASGGGIFVARLVDLTLNDVVVSGNIGEGGTGGMHAERVTTGILTNVIVSNNVGLVRCSLRSLNVL